MIKKIEKHAYSSLTDRQHKNIVDDIEYVMTTADKLKDLEESGMDFTKFIWALESMSFICPAERKAYLEYLGAVQQERASQIVERIQKYGY